ncbi:MAG: macro domain-containing protein [Candidatus Lokiarchaeota archaeon]|nr:macro domain-containing protein [Candidatus Lokiarchaeota archaeon]
MKEIRINNSQLRIIQGDITEVNTDAIVNPANTQLIMGGGVAGAILRKGGSKIQEEADQKAPILVGEAVITNGGNLKAKYIIHTVGPILGEGNEGIKLENAVLNSLKLIDEYKLKSIAFPAISTGIFGYPIEKCAIIMISTIKKYLKNKQTSIEQVIICLFTQKDFKIFEEFIN